MVNGHTGNSTRAKAPASIPNMRPFLEIVVSNLKEQNLASGSLGCTRSRTGGYFRFFMSAGLR